jgi:hypothetical protein
LGGLIKQEGREQTSNCLQQGSPHGVDTIDLERLLQQRSLGDDGSMVVQADPLMREGRGDLVKEMRNEVSSGPNVKAGKPTS